MLSVDFASTLDAYTKDKDDDVLRILIGLTSLGQINWRNDTSAGDRSYYAFLGSGIYVTTERGLFYDEPSLIMGRATVSCDTSTREHPVIAFNWSAGTVVVIRNFGADKAATRKLLDDLIENVEKKLGLLVRRYVVNAKLGNIGQLADVHVTPRDYVYHKPFTENNTLQYDHQKQTIYGDVLAESSEAALDVVTDWKDSNFHLYEVKMYPYDNNRSTVTDLGWHKSVKSAEWVYPEDGAPYVIGRAFGLTGTEVLNMMLDFAKANPPKAPSIAWVLEWVLDKDTRELRFSAVGQNWSSEVDELHDWEYDDLDITYYRKGDCYIIETTVHAYNEEHAKRLGRQMIADFFAIGKDIVSDNKEA